MRVACAIEQTIAADTAAATKRNQPELCLAKIQHDLS